MENKFYIDGIELKIGFEKDFESRKYVPVTLEWFMQNYNKKSDFEKAELEAWLSDLIGDGIFLCTMEIESPGYARIKIGSIIYYMNISNKKNPEIPDNI